MTVVSALVAEDLDPARLKARGAQMLRDFLAYAASGGSARGRGAAPARALDPLVADLADRLSSQGMAVHPGLGASADRIDLAVESLDAPGRLAVAVDFDGPEYAAVTSSRDRDRLRSEQLRRLGWSPLRVWATDVYRDPAREVERIRALASQDQRPAGADDAELVSTASADEALSAAIPHPQAASTAMPTDRHTSGEEGGHRARARRGPGRPGEVPSPPVVDDQDSAPPPARPRHRSPSRPPTTPTQGGASRPSRRPGDVGCASRDRRTGSSRGNEGGAVPPVAGPPRLGALGWISRGRAGCRGSP